LVWVVVCRGGWWCVCVCYTDKGGFTVVCVLCMCAVKAVCAVMKLCLCVWVSYLLMLLPSFSLSPAAPVFAALSLPARSTKLSLLTFSPLVCQRDRSRGEKKRREERRRKE